MGNSVPLILGGLAAGSVAGLFGAGGGLVLVPILAAKNSKYARFHANQGLVLFIAEIIYNFVSAIIRAILPLAVVNIILWVISVLFLVLSIIGIVNAATGKAKELPVIGKIRIIK